MSKSYSSEIVLDMFFCLVSFLFQLLYGRRATCRVGMGWEVGDTNM